jgi:hypothetical protein
MNGLMSKVQSWGQSGVHGPSGLAPCDDLPGIAATEAFARGYGAPSELGDLLQPVGVPAQGEIWEDVESVLTAPRVPTNKSRQAQIVRLGSLGLA